MNETTKRPGVLWRLVRIILYVLGSLLLLMIVVSVWFFTTLYTPASPREGYLTLTGATILVGEELEPQSSTTVLIRDGIIIELSKDGEVDIPPQSEIVDLSGYTMMPGLIDLHVHLASPELKIWRQRLLCHAIVIRSLVMAGQIIGNAGYVIPIAIRLFLQVRMGQQMGIGSPNVSK